MSIPAELLQRVVEAPANADPKRTMPPGTVTGEDATGILEIACMVVAADGQIDDAEIEAVRVLGGAVKKLARTSNGEPLTAAEVAEIAARCAGLTSEDRLARLRAVATALSSDAARHLAYKISLATAMADLASTYEEVELDVDLLDALKLSDVVGDRLAGEVHEAVTPPDGD